MAATYDPTAYAPTTSGSWVSETREQFGGRRQYLGTKRNCWVDGRQSCLRPPVFVHVRGEPRSNDLRQGAAERGQTQATEIAVPAPFVPPTTDSNNDAMLRPAFHAYKVDTVNVLPPRAVKESASDDVASFEVTARPEVSPIADGNEPCLAFHCRQHQRVSNVYKCRGCRFCRVQPSVGCTMSNAERAAAYSRRTAELRRRTAERLLESKQPSCTPRGNNCSTARCDSEPGQQKPLHCPHCHKTKRCESPRGRARSTSPDNRAVPSSELQSPRKEQQSRLVGTDLAMCSGCSIVMRYVPKALCPDCGGTMVPLYAAQRQQRSSSPPSAPALIVPPQTKEQQRREGASTTAEDLSEPLKELLEHVRTLPAGVVPLKSRRTALGDRISVGRARVANGLGDLLAEEASSRRATVAAARWAYEPIDSNDSTRTKSCLTWA